MCFNSSVGILVVRTVAESAAARRSVSIPRSEFWSFGRVRMHCSPRGFNSSVGILVVRTTWRTRCTSILFQFQFLGRNSGRSDVVKTLGAEETLAGFNSSVGILVVRT